MDEEAALLIRLQGGDELALADLYHRLSGKVYTLAQRMLGSREEAEEVLQDTFLKVYRDPRGYQAGIGSPRAYVYTVARNACLSRLRAKGARPTAAEDWDVHDPGVHLTAAADDPLEGALARQALARLEPLDRRLLEEAFFAGYSHGELATRSGLPLGTVKSRVRRALLSLRRFLEEA